MILDEPILVEAAGTVLVLAVILLICGALRLVVVGVLQPIFRRNRSDQRSD